MNISAPSLDNSKTTTTHGNNSVTRRNLDSKKQKTPDYVYPENISKRYRILSNFPLTEDMTTCFNLMCDYVRLENDESPIINLKDLQLFISEKKILSDNATYSIINQIVDLLKTDETQIIEVLEYHNNSSTKKPTIIVLKEYTNVNFKILNALQKKLNQTYTDINNKKVSFPSLAHLARDLSCETGVIQELCLTLPVEDLTLKQLLDAGYSKNIGIIITLSEEFREIVVPVNFVSKFVYLLVSMIKSFYESDENRRINREIEKKIKQQSITSENINEVLSNALIQDPSFLSFSQIFYQVMLDLNDRYKDINSIDATIKNNLIASIILTKISFNRREEIRKKEAEEEMRKAHFNQIQLYILNKKTNTKFINNIIFPSNIEDLEQIECKFGYEMKGSKKEISSPTILEEYGREEILHYLQQLNENKHLIKNILIFKEQSVFWYIHRARLITTFFSLLQNERKSITDALTKKWSSNIALIPKNHETSALDLLIKDYTSPFFENFYKLLIQILIIQVPDEMAENNTEYLLTRLFLNEGEILKLKNLSSDLKFENLEQKKKLLTLCMETLFDKNQQPRKPHLLFQIFTADIKKDVLDIVKPNIFKKIILTISDSWAAFLHLVRISPKKISLSSLNQKTVIKKLANSTSNFLHKESTPNTQPQKNSSSPDLPTPNTESTNKTKLALTQLKTNFPMLSNINDLKKQIKTYLEDWNLKIGLAREEQTNYVNSLAEKLSKSIQIEQFNEDRIKEGFQVIIHNNPNLKKVTNTAGLESLKKYLFYLTALYKYQQIDGELKNSP